jgi:hypothetical protein
MTERPLMPSQRQLDSGRTKTVEGSRERGIQGNKCRVTGVEGVRQQFLGVAGGRGIVPGLKRLIMQNVGDVTLPACLSYCSFERNHEVGQLHKHRTSNVSRTCDTHISVPKTLFARKSYVVPCVMDCTTSRAEATTGVITTSIQGKIRDHSWKGVQCVWNSGQAGKKQC